MTAMYHDDATDPYPGLPRELRQYVWGMINTVLAEERASFDRHYAKLNNAKWDKLKQVFAEALKLQEQQLRQEFEEKLVKVGEVWGRVLRRELDKLREEMAEQPEPPQPVDDNQGKHDDEPEAVPANPDTISLTLSPSPSPAAAESA